MGAAQALSFLAIVATPVGGFAQVATNTTGSQACAAIVNAAATGLAARIQADNATILPPQSVNKLSCLTKIFGGVAGLDLVSSLVSPSKLLGTIENQLANQVCALAQEAWQDTLGSLQCGLTVTGFNTGFGLGLGGGQLCPKLTFGGGGPSLGAVGTGLNGQQSYGVYMSGQPGVPTGYPFPQTGGLY